jgi:fatty acid/phospholipid biosynthesis enzyme
VIICHGKSNERAIKNAIIKAKGFVEKNLNGHIKAGVQEYASRAGNKES